MDWTLDSPTSVLKAALREAELAEENNSRDAAITADVIATELDRRDGWGVVNIWGRESASRPPIASGFAR